MRLDKDGSMVHIIGRCIVYLVSIISFFFSSATINLSAQNVDVKLFEQGIYDTLLFSPAEGIFALIIGEDTVAKLSSNEVIRVSNEGKSFKVKALLAKVDTTIKEFNLGAINGSFKVKRNNRREESFEGNVRAFFGKKEKGLFVNQVGLDSYVSRVLIEEVGYNVPEEFLKIQAIISRTYAIRNKARHSADGYDLCNSVHCQVYDGKKEIPSNIHLATAATSGTLITDTTGTPILAAFHANCGGQTANSEHVWNSPLSYLKSTKDTFCLRQRSANWQKQIELSKLKKYIHNQSGLNIDSVNWQDLTLSSNRSEKTIEIFGEPFSLPMLRRDLRLKSTLFTMNIENDVANFVGRGFGHGVGLCQQGAINMARQGFDHKQILGYYFKGTRLEPISDPLLSK